MRVEELMTSEVKTCQSASTLAEAAALMWENDCGVIPVIDQYGNLRGVISDRDICIAAATKNRLASEITAGEVMAIKVYACAPDDDVSKALKTMQEQQVRRLPVVAEDGSLRGILSISDILMRAEKGSGRILVDLSFEDAINTLKAICEPRQFAETARREARTVQA